MAVIKKKKKNGNILGTIGDNYIVKDCPVLIPQQNMKTFSEFQKASNTTNTFGNWPNPFDIWNKK